MLGIEGGLNLSFRAGESSLFELEIAKKHYKIIIVNPYR
jgi:hypothetical protein